MVNSSSNRETMMANLSIRERRSILFVVALTLMMVVSAVSGLNVALPSLARATGATQREMQWIVDAYTVVFAGLLLFSGAVGDRFGRKNILIVGVVVFGAAASFALIFHQPVQLIVIRALMGVGAAFVMPTTLSIITTSFPPDERGKAVGVWVAVVGGGAVIGLIGTGILLEFFDWSSFFTLNVCLAILGLIGAITSIPNSKDPQPHRLDVVGAVLSLLTVTTLVYAIIEGPVKGWSNTYVITSFVIGAVGAISFVKFELSAKEPMLDPRLFKLRGFGIGSLSLTVQFFAAFGFFFTILQYLQFVIGYSALKATLCMLPMPLAMAPLARNAPRIAAKVGLNRVAGFGLASMAFGFYLFSQVLTTDFVYWKFMLCLLFFGMGMGAAGTPATTAIVSSLPDSKQGVASAVNDTSREFGSALGIAILGSILNNHYRDSISSALTQLPPQIQDGVKGSIAFVQSDVLKKMNFDASALVERAKISFLDGVHAAFMTTSIVLIVAAIVVFKFAPAKD